MGYISTLQTKLEQILCSRGYTDTLAGTAAALIIGAGFLASFPIGLLAMKTGKMILISKAACLPAIFTMVLSTWVLGQSDMEPVVLVTCAAMGFFSLGIYPVMLELSVECTYPLDESVVTGLCYLSSALQGSILMGVENMFNSPLPTQWERDKQTCSPTMIGETGHKGGMEAKNLNNYLILINTYMAGLIVTYLLFFRTEYKRSKENEAGRLGNSKMEEEMVQQLMKSSEGREEEGKEVKKIKI